MAGSDILMSVVGVASMVGLVALCWPLLWRKESLTDRALSLLAGGQDGLLPDERAA